MEKYKSSSKQQKFDGHRRTTGWTIKDDEGVVDVVEVEGVPLYTAEAVAATVVGVVTHSDNIDRERKRGCC